MTNLSKKTTSAITDLLLFTTKRANAIKTLLDMTAASASLATMTMTVSQVVSRGEGSIHEVYQHVQTLLKRLCGEFDTIQ